MQKTETRSVLPPLAGDIAPHVAAAEPGAVFAGAPGGLAAPILTALAARHGGRAVFIALDDAGMMAMRESLLFCGVEAARIKLFPAWDCLPYDRISPRTAIVGQRVQCLAELHAASPAAAPAVILTTINAWVQRVMPECALRDSSLRLAPGVEVPPERLKNFFTANGYHRVETVRETGEYARRGGIIDIFPPGHAAAVRVDLFGDAIETMRFFDPETQRSSGACGDAGVVLYPTAEFAMTDETISAFRQKYIQSFGGNGTQVQGDPLYQAVSAGRLYPGLEHLLPLFHSRLATLADYLSDDTPVLLAHEGRATAEARLAKIEEFYRARMQAQNDDDGDDGDGDGDTWRVLPPSALYINRGEWEAMHASMYRLSPFAEEGGIDCGGRAGATFHRPGDASHSPAAEVAGVIAAEMEKQGTVILAASSAGSLDRMTGMIERHLPEHIPITPAPTLDAITAPGAYAAIWPVEDGLALGGVRVITEKDLYGGRMISPASRTRRRQRGENFLREVSALEEGDLVVHVDHGIGRYGGLEKITTAAPAHPAAPRDGRGGAAGGVVHDCLLIVYAGGDRLFLPVENIDLLSRYGKDGGDVALDRLGGVAWQQRRARIKGRLRDIAARLIRIAAARETADMEPVIPEPEAYAAFCRGFAYMPTEDQAAAIDDVMADLASGKVMDRLICGDVGFGKTEIALRAAYAMGMAGYQVAVITPTTLLARQHGQVFGARFRNTPLRVGTLSRLTPPARAAAIRKEIASGECSIAIGTHALLGKSISFNNPGLVIIDEEQHFGVAQKERLKELRGTLHVLTLSATPIPRTLQMALVGVRAMSVIASPPTDRLAVRTAIGPWDKVVLREAIHRERFRGGQVFCVVPRIEQIAPVHDRLAAMAGDARIITAHGRMPPEQLDEAMTRFGDGNADILLTTNIIESGLDIPRANTIIIHRADMFGLAQLYQLRGRVGRGRKRAYAHLTTDPARLMTATARRRLEVMQTLDELGAGFSLASHDLDIRGAGNLLGEEQSGHVREVGVELYQDMLREAVKAARLGAGEADTAEETWSPVVNLGLAVLIPDGYVPDLVVRLALYRRMATLTDAAEIEALGAELVDRFGAMPQEVKNLMDTIGIKILCRRAHVAKIDAGPKGLSLSFRRDSFPEPDRLIGLIADSKGHLRMGADHRLTCSMTLPFARRVAAAQDLLGAIAGLLDT